MQMPAYLKVKLLLLTAAKDFNDLYLPAFSLSIKIASFYSACCYICTYIDENKSIKIIKIIIYYSKWIFIKIGKVLFFETN